MSDNKLSFQESAYEVNPESNFSDNFTDKQPIKTSGTTCDTFSARYESRHVFIKQLKSELATNPVYRTAFKKEYEIGSSLRHPSLPLYLRFSGDAIIMEFIDGKTLHEMLWQKDSWLNKDKNIEKLIGQLLNVLDYLHARNVIHCDIKADNMMVTHDTRNLILIDLDKGFTDSLDSTPGTPLNYSEATEHISKREMDIRGVGMIVENLLPLAQTEKLKERLHTLIKASKRQDTSIQDLIEIWDKSEKSANSKTAKLKAFKVISLIFGSVILAALLVLIWSKGSYEEIINDKNVDLPEISVEETEQENDNHLIQNRLSENEIKVSSPDNNIVDIETQTNTDTINWDVLLKEDLSPMWQLLDEIESDLNDNKISSDDVVSIVFKINDENNSFNNNVSEKYSRKFPALSQEILLIIYASASVKEMIAKRDYIYQRLIELQQRIDL